MEGFPSGQREQTVNLSAEPSEVRILPPPPLVLARGSGLAVLSRESGNSSMVEHQPSKLRVAGSSLVSRSRIVLSVQDVQFR